MQASRAPWICGSLTAVFIILFFEVPGGPCAFNLNFLLLAIPCFAATCFFGLLSNTELGDRFLSLFESNNSAERAEWRLRRLQQRLGAMEARRFVPPTPRDNSAPRA